MAQLNNPIAPRLPAAPPEYEPRHEDQVRSMLRLYFNQLDASLQQVLLGFNHYGTFYDTTTQTNPTINTPMAVTFNSTSEAYGVSLKAGDTAKIVAARDGVYNFQFSSQLDNVGGGAATFYIWFAINGTAIPHSAGKVVISGVSDEKVAAWNYLVTMQAGDEFQLMWSSDSLDAVIRAVAAASPIPAIPSTIMTVTYVYPNAAVRA